MHGCMAQLLKEEGNPRAEDVECLCKLLSTVGQLLDRSTREEQKLAMPVRACGAWGETAAWEFGQTERHGPCHCCVQQMEVTAAAH